MHSARFAGEGAGDAANNAKLMASMQNVPIEKRSARYRAVIVLVRTTNDMSPLIGEGTWEGRIALAPRGLGGFGYDPLFEPGDIPGTAAELSPADKNARSHRGSALRALVAQWSR